MAFEIRDDVAGIWSSVDETGKTVASHIARRKWTFPVVWAIAQPSSTPRTAWLEAYARADSLDVATVERIVDALDSSARAKPPPRRPRSIWRLWRGTQIGSFASISRVRWGSPPLAEDKGRSVNVNGTVRAPARQDSLAWALPALLASWDSSFGYSSLTTRVSRPTSGTYAAWAIGLESNTVSRRSTPRSASRITHPAIFTSWPRSAESGISSLPRTIKASRCCATSFKLPGNPSRILASVRCSMQSSAALASAGLRARLPRRSTFSIRRRSTYPRCGDRSIPSQAVSHYSRSMPCCAAKTRLRKPALIWVGSRLPGSRSRTRCSSSRKPRAAALARSLCLRRPAAPPRTRGSRPRSALELRDSARAAPYRAVPPE